MKTTRTFSILFFLLFVSFVANSQVPTRVGWWKFDNASDMLKAEIGAPLELAGTQLSVPGPVAENLATQLDKGNYLTLTHGIAPNGGGTLVNEYTLQIDFSVPAIGVWHTFFQTDPTNGGDGDLFTKDATNAIGVGDLGYSSGTVAADTWYRMVISVRNGEFYKVYVNGALWLSSTAPTIDGRFALANVLLMFGDNDGDDALINCSEIGIWDVALEDYEVTQLGDAFGDRVRVRTKVGSWKFDDAADMLKADVGSALELTGTQVSVAGPEAGNLATKIGLGSYLKSTHGIALNGEDTLVNEYSIQMDFQVPEVGKWHTFFQTDPTNTSDGELFTKDGDNTIGTAVTGYSTNAITANSWYRMVIAVKNDNSFKVYLNGELWIDAAGQGIDGRFGLKKALLFFADNDGDDADIICSEINLYEVALTADEVAALGTDPSNAIPERVGWWKFDDFADLMKAEVGSPLVLAGTVETTTGPVAGNQAVSLGVGSNLAMTHGISFNGGGAMVNEYSLQIDFSVPQIGIWHAFFQTSPANGDDADLFINGGSSIPNTIGTATTGYSTNAVSADTWYRMIVSVKNGSFFKVYLNGEEWSAGAGQSLDGRFALADVLLLFGDDDGDDAAIACSEAGIWDVALTADQVAKLGDASTSPGTGIRNNVAGRSNDLGQNYPNPFSVSTTFPYEISKTGNVSFRILDLSGREMQLINEGIKNPGKYTLELNSNNLKAGVYYFQMKNNEQTSIRKMIVVR
jgi:hypothetical protein